MCIYTSLPGLLEIRQMANWRSGKAPFILNKSQQFTVIMNLKNPSPSPFQLQNSLYPIPLSLSSDHLFSDICSNSEQRGEDLLHHRLKTQPSSW